MVGAAEGGAAGVVVAEPLRYSTMLATRIQTNTARKPTNPIGVTDTIVITIAAHASHLGRPPWRRTQIPVASMNKAITARNGRKMIANVPISADAIRRES